MTYRGIGCPRAPVQLFRESIVALGPASFRPTSSVAKLSALGDDSPPDCLLAGIRQSPSSNPRAHTALEDKEKLAHPIRFERVTFAFGGQRSTLRVALDRHNLLGIEPVVDPISPMLHQFRARADQRERSVLFVEPFHCRVVEMRELQLDDIAIPCLSVLDLFVVRQGREGSPESVGAMISLGINAKQPQALVERVV